jgi:hypothetical protein
MAAATHLVGQQPRAPADALGPTIRSAIGRARSSIFGTRRPDDLWSPTALPIRDEAATYVARHGWGYSRFEHTSHGIAAELLEYVPLADPI